MGRATSRDDDDVRRFPDNGARLRPDAKMELDASCPTLLHPPVDDAIISLRRGLLDVSLTCPPGSSAPSKTTTSCPRSAATRAARPPGPAPTTTTFFRPPALG